MASDVQVLNGIRVAGDGRWFWLIGLEADRHLPGLLAAIELLGEHTGEVLAELGVQP